jgi:hypothetical protein
MSSNQSRIRDFLLEEQLGAMEEFERTLVERGRVPDRRKLPHRQLGPILRVTGALVLALNVALLVLLGNFIVFNMMIHAF